MKLVGGRLASSYRDGEDRPDRIRVALTGWFQEYAEQKLREKSVRYAKIVGVTPYPVAIKTFKRRWGSCSTGGRIQFNWRINIAPNRVIDYVIAHELCTMRQHYHSPKFWKCVERVFSDYQECRDWLKVNGWTLTV